jgi:phage terminase large subunit-like protein
VEARLQTCEEEVTAVESPAERLAALPPDEREQLLAEQARQHGMTVPQLKAMLHNEWRFTARPKQIPPADPWTFFWVRAGRGWGKTLTAAQWATRKALTARTRGAVIGPTLGDVRRTIFEGETGLLSVIPNHALLGQSRAVAWNKSLLELTLANGTVITGFSSEEPDRLRGPQHHWVWGEEVSSWKDADHPATGEDTTWSNMTLGMRLGANPQAFLTSTPKPNRLSRDLMEMAVQGRLSLVTGSSYENRVNLSDAWWRAVVAPLEGTRTGRQEIEAELLEDVEGALWTRTIIDRCRVTDHPPLSLTVVAVDPNTESGESSDNAGIIVAGQNYSTGHVYVLADHTVTKGGPAVWAQRAVDAYHEHGADMIVAEKNQGGQMVRLTIQGVDPDVPVELVTASVGKRTRAEPVAVRYLDKPDIPHDVHHVGALPDLEDEMVTWVPGQRSPDRMDALTWAISKLLIGRVRRQMTTHVARTRLDGGAAGDQVSRARGDDLSGLG